MSSAAPTATTTLESAPLTGESDPYLSDKAAALRSPAPEWQIGILAGFAGGNFVENDKWLQGPVFGLRIANLKHERPEWDFQIELEKDNVVGVFGAKRWYVENDEFIPYARLAVGTFLDPNDELGNLVEIKRFRVRAGVGMGEAFVFEMGVGVAVVGPDLYALLGYNFNF